MIFLIALIAVGTAFLVINEFVTLLVYGQLIKGDKLKTIVDKYLGKGYWHSGHILTGYPFGGTFISIANSLLSKWYINKIGRVPRWSNEHKLIEEAHLKYLIGENYDKEE